MDVTLAKALLVSWAAVIAAGMFRGCDPLPTPAVASPAGNVAAPTAAPTPNPSPTATAAEDVFPRDARVVTILHSNDVRGEVDPCG